MTHRRLVPALCISLALALAAGCQGSSTAPGPVVQPNPNPSPGGDPKIRAALDKLPAEDRALADAQKRCPITDEALGSMGVPIKLTLKDQAVLLCCKGCVKDAEADPDGTLKKVAELKAKNAK